MCGIAGYLLGPHARIAPGLALRALVDPLRARGPDDEGACLIHRPERRVTHCRTDRTVPAVAARLPHFRDAAGREPHDAALFNTRFAIIDLSAGGHQPFTSHDGSVVVVFHGEIYNHPELRTELADWGVVFRTSSDTEVLVEGYRRWRDRLWERLNGFWAVALYDGVDGSIVLCRDRFGVAPLYYREGAGGLYFASSIQPLLDVEPSSAAVDHTVVHGFIETSLKDYDAATCYAPVRSILPATALRIPASSASLVDAASTSFWTYPERPVAASDLSFPEAVRRFRAVFMDAVAVRLRSDVRLAFELSGGLDSSSIVAAAATQGAAVTAYTLEVPEHSEEKYARTLLRRYDIDYRVIQHGEEHLLEDAADFVRIMEEPFHSPNVYTHYRLRRAMKRDGVHVVLSGSGGDEVLAGYPHDFWPRARAELRRERRALQAFACDLHFRMRGVGRARTEAQTAIHNRAEGLARSYAGLDFHRQRLYHFQVGLLPYYLRSDDHFSMALPMEQRSPFLDYRLVELGLRLPAAYLFRGGWTKYVLRKAMEPYLPREIVWRREKMGFPFPLRSFLERERAHFGPLLARVAGAGLTPQPVDDYDALVARQPARLWRICSTGLWLDHALRAAGDPQRNTAVSLEALPSGP